MKVSVDITAQCEHCTQETKHTIHEDKITCIECEYTRKVTKTERTEITSTLYPIANYLWCNKGNTYDM